MSSLFTRVNKGFSNAFILELKGDEKKIKDEILNAVKNPDNPKGTGWVKVERNRVMRFLHEWFPWYVASAKFYYNIELELENDAAVSRIQKVLDNMKIFYVEELGEASLKLEVLKAAHLDDDGSTRGPYTCKITIKV